MATAPAGTTKAQARSPKNAVGLGDDGHLPHVGVGEEVVFDLIGSDVASARDDDVLQPSRDPEVTVIVDSAEVTGRRTIAARLLL